MSPGNLQIPRLDKSPAHTYVPGNLKEDPHEVDLNEGTFYP
jgi:hypothetical protein